MMSKSCILIVFVVIIARTFGQQSGCKSSKIQSGEQGKFSSINYPQSYTSYSTCEWLITVPANKMIKLTFDDNFDIEKSSSSGNCFDSVKVFAGSNSSNGLIGEFCGKVAPSPIFVNSSQAFVTFTSDRSVQFNGFNVQWNAVDKVKNDTTEDQQSGCNSPRFQSGERGIISSMNYPSKYVPLANCQWWITVPATKKIKLTFKNLFNLESGSLVTCYDSVEVFKGANFTNEKIGQYCGTIAPKPIFVNGNHAVVRFNSDTSNQKEGFSIEWSAVDNVINESSVEQTSGCNSPKLQSGERGNFSSINYPQDYTSFLKCEWLIKVSATKIIKLTFNDNFGIEKSLDTGICYDSVKVFKGSDSSNGFIGEYCGRFSPRPIFVKSSEAFVIFKSDRSVQLKGFSVQWEAVDNATINTTDDSNIFKWNGSEYYLGKNDSTWQEARDFCRKIWGHENGDLVSINNAEENDFLFNIASRNTDYLAWIGANDIISEGKFVWTDNSPVTFRRWKSGEPNNYFNEDCAHLSGNSDARWNDKHCCTKMWFICERRKTNVNNDIEQSGCRSPKLQTGERGNFSSMNYPASYPDLVNCSWLITVPTSRIIKIEFDDNFGLQKNLWNGRCDDFVEVFDGSNSSGEKIGTFCGKTAPTLLFSKSNQVFVTFTSDKSFQYNGFSIQWSAVVNVTEVTSNDPNVFKWNGTEYYRGTIESTWQEARDVCREIWGTGNGDLVTIDNEEENIFLFNNIYNLRTQRNKEEGKFVSPNKIRYLSWIGANDIEEEGKFVWPNKRPLQFSNWNIGEPNNEGNENCAHFLGDSSSAKWNDAPCCAKMWFICEKATV